MKSRFHLSNRFIICALIVLGIMTLFATPTVAQPVDGTEAPAEFQRDLVDDDSPGGTTDEIDAADAQYEAAEADGGDIPGATRRVTTQVEEIVVSARKRAEALEDTPVAVTALTASTLREAGVYRVDQVAELVPNLQFQDSIQGNLAQFAIRGVGTGAPDIQFDPGVALYLDGVFLPRASGSLLSVVDVQQIEVLRGPQGTLFGKNSVGGAINMTTVKPHHDFEGFAMVRPGNFNSVETEVMLNVPIVEDFLLSRVALFTANRDGYVHNTAQDKYYSNRDEIAFLGSLRFLLTDDLTFDLSGTWSRSHTLGRGGRCVVVNEDAPLSSLYGGFYPECKKTSLFENNANIQGMSDIEGYGTWGVFNYDLGDVWEIEDLAIKALGSWNEQIPRTRFDVDNTSAEVVVLSTAGGSEFDGAPGKQQQTSGELQVNGAAFDGMLVFVGGLFAQWENAADTRTTVVGPPLNRFTTNVSEIKNWTWAPYLQATADFTEWLSITGGIRYTQDNKELTLSQFVSNTGEVLLDEVNDSELFTAWTPMASIASTVPFDLLPDSVDHVMGYFTYAQGFKGGGFNALPGPRNQEGTDALAAAFQPETLNNFELGLKSIYLDNRLTLNLAGFYGKYDDIQKVSVQAVGFDEQGVPIIQRITENAAVATIKGFEIEAQAYPVEGLQITGNIGYTDATYDDFPNAVSDLTDQSIDRSGETFNNVPKFTSFLAVQYSWLIEGADEAEILQGWLTPRLEWYYQSMVHLNGPELADSVQSGYNLLNARLSYAFWDDRAQVALWGKNLTDETFINWSTPTVSTFGFLVNFPGLPRTWGGEISYRF
ncbi:MAG: TonB-dependent receptor [Candidatus Binatia bacterium]|nr:TonB-dependent receptor [Candidatus Binatia bacterium]